MALLFPPAKQRFNIPAKLVDKGDLLSVRSNRSVATQVETPAT